MTDKQFVYFADPMCSWCYGFAPVMAELVDRFQDRLGLQVVVGGLRAGNAEPMTARDRDYIKDAWSKVAAATAQPFNDAFIAREGFVYDTEPACRAVVAARRLQSTMALPMMSRLSSAFYAEGRDTTSPAELAEIAEEAGFDRDAFATTFAASETQSETFRDFLIAQELGIRGFPTLIAGSETGGYALLTNGYRPLEDLAGPIARWLDAGAPVTKAGG